MRISDWSSDVCSSDLRPAALAVFDVPNEGSGAAVLDRRYHLELGKAQMSGMGKAISRPGSAEDVGNLMDVCGPTRLVIPAARTGVHRSTPQLKESIESACVGSRSSQAHRRHAQREDRTSVVQGKGVSVRVEPGGRRCIKKKKKK